jgi:hypothetical protein
MLAKVDSRERKTMKLAIGTAFFVLLASAPAYPRQEPDREKAKDKSSPQEDPKKQEREKQKPQQQERERQQQDRQQEKQEKDQSERARQQQAGKHQQQAEKDRSKQDKEVLERERRDQTNTQPSRRDGANRNARRVRQEDFSAHFGREHRFRVERRDDRRFNYGGYWFEFGDRWPSAWSYDDDVYVDEIDGGYYLIDPVHPGLRVLVIVVD